MIKSAFCLLFASLVAALSPFAEAADAVVDFPNRPVRLMLPFPPGGPVEAPMRLLAAKLQALWGKPVVVENKPGAGTVINTDFVAKSQPDGTTIGLVVGAYFINPSLRSSLPYDTLRDLSGVTQLVRAHMVLVAHPSLPANNIRELVDYAKANPGKLSYATPGSGTATHILGELFKSMAGIEITHVPYRGSSPAYADLITGRVTLMFDVMHPMMPFIKDGKVKVLGLTSPERPKAYSEYPVIAETIPGYSAASNWGLIVPSATPRALVHKIQADVAAVLGATDIRSKYLELGLETVGSTPEAFDALIKTEIDRWAPVVRTSGARVD